MWLFNWIWPVFMQSSWILFCSVILSHLVLFFALSSKSQAWISKWRPACMFSVPTFLLKFLYQNCFKIYSAVKKIFFSCSFKTSLKLCTFSCLYSDGVSEIQSKSQWDDGKGDVGRFRGTYTLFLLQPYWIYFRPLLISCFFISFKLLFIMFLRTCLGQLELL